MAEVAVIGAGHAGVEAAFALAKKGVHVTLYSNEAVLPYFRPRLIAVAFGQSAPEAIAMKPLAAYEQVGITLMRAAAAQLDGAKRSVNGNVYDGIILAQGSQPFVPAFSGRGAGGIKTLWTMADALALRERVTAGETLAIIGGGVLGLEAALRAKMAGMHVTVIEGSSVLLGGVLGKCGEAVLKSTLEMKGISVITGCQVASIEPGQVLLADGRVINAGLVLCATGARPEVTLAETAGLRIAGGVQTKDDLSAMPGVYVAGDQARPGQMRPVCAVMRAMKMGALAAENLWKSFMGVQGVAWKELALPLFMKVEDVEFHTQGDVVSEDVTEERLDDGNDAHVWKSVLRREGQVVGLRWVGTRSGFAEWSKQLPLA